MLLVSTCISGRIAHSAEFIPLGVPLTNESAQGPLAVSDGADLVVGYADGPLFDDLSGFIWTESSGIIGSDTFLPRSLPTAVSDDGVVVAGHVPVLVPQGHAAPFRYTTASGVEYLELLQSAFPQLEGTVNDLSSDGQIAVGTSLRIDGLTSVYWDRDGNIHDIGKLTDLVGATSVAEAVSADGQTIVGFSETTELPLVAFRWTAATGMLPLGDADSGFLISNALDASHDGSVIVGYSAVSRQPTDAFRWTDTSGFEELGHLPGLSHSIARSVSGDGSTIIGQAFNLGNVPDQSRSFVWDMTHGMRDLQQLLETHYQLATELLGWTLSNPNDISRDGLAIVGNGINPNGELESWLVRLDRPIGIPEPVTFLIALSGLYCIGTMRRCRKARSSIRRRRDKGTFYFS